MARVGSTVVNELTNELQKRPNEGSDVETAGSGVEQANGNHHDDSGINMKKLLRKADLRIVPLLRRG